MERQRVRAKTLKMQSNRIKIGHTKTQMWLYGFYKNINNFNFYFTFNWKNYDEISNSIITSNNNC